MNNSLQIVLLLTIVGISDTVLGETQNGEIVEDSLTNNTPLATSVTQCSLPPDDENKVARLDSLRDNAVSCAMDSNGTSLKGIITNVNNSEELRENINSYCKLKPIADECFVTTSSQGEICLNSTQQQILKSTGELFINFLRVVCQNNGEGLATVISAVKTLASNKSPILLVIKNCLNDVEKLDNFLDVKSYDPTLYSRSLYSIVKFMKTCIKERVDGQDEAKTVFDYLITDLLHTMKCVATGGEQIPCETIDQL